MHVGTIRLTLLIPGAESLKDKRRVVRSLVETARRRFNASIAEVGDHDLWQRALILVAVAGSDAGQVNSALDKILDHFETSGYAGVAGAEVEIEPR